MAINLSAPVHFSQVHKRTYRKRGTSGNPKPKGIGRTLKIRLRRRQTWAGFAEHAAPLGSARALVMSNQVWRRY